VHAERRRDAHAHAGMARARLARELRHVAQRVAAGREEVGHHHDLARARRDAGVDRFGQARAREREVRNADGATGQAALERGRDGSELAIRGALAAAVIDEQHGAPGRAPRLHQ
jgi:hypothetical protein